MAFLVRRPVIYITIGVLLLATSLILLYFGGGFETRLDKPAFSRKDSPKLEKTAVTMNQDPNTTLTATIENYSSDGRNVTFQIRTTTLNLKFYYSNNGSLLPEPMKFGENNYTFYYAKHYMNPGEEWGFSLTIEGGLEEDQDSWKYVFVLEVYSDEVLTDTWDVQLLVDRE